MNITEHELVEAERNMASLRGEARAVSAHYDRRTDRVLVRLNTGLELAFPPSMAEGLADASAADLNQIEVSPAGLGLHWPRLDADLYLPALLQGVFGSPGWMAAQLGASGGRARSTAKTAAARENGRKGGRPRTRTLG